jgi:hypothetical protein
VLVKQAVGLRVEVEVESLQVVGWTGVENEVVAVARERVGVEEGVCRPEPEQILPGHSEAGRATQGLGGGVSLS